MKGLNAPRIIALAIVAVILGVASAGCDLGMIKDDTAETHPADDGQTGGTSDGGQTTSTSDDGDTNQGNDTNDDTEPDVEWIPLSGLSCPSIGGNNVAGDTEMDTDPNDINAIDFHSELRVNYVENAVYCYVRSKFLEHGGDGTQIIVEHEALVYRAPQGRSIVAVEANGGLVVTLSTQSEGRIHTWVPFPGSSGTYWNGTLEFRKDTSSSNDCPHIGTRGSVGLRVGLQ